MTSFNLNYPLDTVSPDTVTLGIRACTYEWGREDTIQSIAPTEPLRQFAGAPWVPLTVVITVAVYWMSSMFMAPR